MLVLTQPCAQNASPGGSPCNGFAGNNQHFNHDGGRVGTENWPSSTVFEYRRLIDVAREVEEHILRVL